MATHAAKHTPPNRRGMRFVSLSASPVSTPFAHSRIARRVQGADGAGHAHGHHQHGCEAHHLFQYHEGPSLRSLRRNGGRVDFDLRRSRSRSPSSQGCGATAGQMMKAASTASSPHRDWCPTGRVFANAHASAPTTPAGGEGHQPCDQHAARHVPADLAALLTQARPDDGAGAHLRGGQREAQMRRHEDSRGRAGLCGEACGVLISVSPCPACG